MDIEWYQGKVKTLPMGKRVAGSIYLHVDAFQAIEPDLLAAICGMIEAVSPGA